METKNFTQTSGQPLGSESDFSVQSVILQAWVQVHISGQKRLPGSGLPLFGVIDQGCLGPTLDCSTGDAFLP